MENLLTWCQKNYHLREELDYERDAYFAPKKFTINIRKDVPIHEIANEVKKIAASVKPIMKTNPYHFLNTIIFQSLKDFENKVPPKKQQIDYLNKYSCFLYFITVTKKFKSNEDHLLEKFKGESSEKTLHICENHKNKKGLFAEKIVYVGISSELIGRYTDGHNVTQKLNDPKWNTNLYEKKIYIATVEVNADIGSEGNVDLPLEALKPYKLVDSILRFLESFFISYFGIPEYNDRDTLPKIDFPSWPKIPFVEEILLPQYNESLLFNDSIEIEIEKKIEILNPSIEQKLKSLQNLKKQKKTSS